MIQLIGGLLSLMGLVVVVLGLFVQPLIAKALVITSGILVFYAGYFLAVNSKL